MQELVKVVVDAMGGDNAPQETVKGAVDAVNTRKDIKVILTGRQELVEGELSKYTRRFRIRWKYRSCSGRRTGDCRQDQRRGASAPCTADPHEGWGSTAD